MSSISENSQMDAIEFVEKHCRFFDEGDQPEDFSPSRSKGSPQRDKMQTGPEEPESRQDDSLEDF